MSMSEKIRIVNNQPRLVVLPNAVVDGKTVDGVRLIPGGNNVDRAYWDAVLARNDKPGRQVRDMVTRKDLSEDKSARATARPEGPDSPESLAEVKPAAAIAMVKSETRADVLAGWAAREKRKNVREAISARLRALEGENDEGEGEETDDANE